MSPWLWIIIMPIALGVALTAYLMGLHWLGKRLGWPVQSPWFPVLAMTGLGLLLSITIGIPG